MSRNQLHSSSLGPHSLSTKQRALGPWHCTELQGGGGDAGPTRVPARILQDGRAPRVQTPAVNKAAEGKALFPREQERSNCRSRAGAGKAGYAGVDAGGATRGHWCGEVSCSESQPARAGGAGAKVKELPPRCAQLRPPRTRPLRTGRLQRLRLPQPPHSPDCSSPPPARTRITQQPSHAAASGVV